MKLSFYRITFCSSLKIIIILNFVYSFVLVYNLNSICISINFRLSLYNRFILFDTTKIFKLTGGKKSRDFCKTYRIYNILVYKTIVIIVCCFWEKILYSFFFQVVNQNLPPFPFTYRNSLYSWQIYLLLCLFPPAPPPAVVLAVMYLSLCFCFSLRLCECESYCCSSSKRRGFSPPDDPPTPPPLVLVDLRRMDELRGAWSPRAS